MTTARYLDEHGARVEVTGDDGVVRSFPAVGTYQPWLDVLAAVKAGKLTIAAYTPQTASPPAAPAAASPAS